MEHIRENWIKVLEWPSEDPELYLVRGTKGDVAVRVIQLFGNTVGHPCGGHSEEEGHRDRSG